MGNPVIIDTGPLIALLNGRDQRHTWAKSQIDLITDPLMTCEAVLSEVFFILRNNVPGGEESLCKMIDRGILMSEFCFKEHSHRVLEILQKHRDLPTSFADACLVCMVENLNKAKIFTLDRDFKIYRKHNRQIIPLLYPN